MQKAASDLFIDQVREKVGPYGGQKLKGTFIEHSIVKHQNILMREINEHYKTAKIQVENEQKIASATILLSMYKQYILEKSFNDVTEYVKAWKRLQTEYFSKVPGHFKYEEWSKFSMETMATGIEQIVLMTEPIKTTTVTVN